MRDRLNLFWNSSLAELKKAYVYDFPSTTYICLLCGEEFLDGQVYSIDGQFYEAKKAVEIHIRKEHTSVFAFLLGMDKRYTGLTEHQKQLLTLFAQGLSDKEIAERLGCSQSTVRNHRFNFREKEKEAKITLALLELLREESAKAGKKAEAPLVEPHFHAAMVDERYVITQEEKDKVLAQCFKDGLEGPLSHFPKKEKRKLIALRQLQTRFVPGRPYTEKEVNAILAAAYPDYTTLRRYLVDYGLLKRLPDGSAYSVE